MRALELVGFLASRIALLAAIAGYWCWLERSVERSEEKRQARRARRAALRAMKDIDGEVRSAQAAMWDVVREQRLKSRG